MDEILVFAAIGFAAQLVDGALGMAYGITATAAMLSFGVTPAVASASVHAAEVVTTGVSGFAHWQFGNIDRALFRDLVIPGMIGGVIGAYLLASAPGEAIRPFVNAYLLAIGGLILFRALARRRPIEGRPRRRLPVLGLSGGLLDALGEAAGVPSSPRRWSAAARRRATRSAPPISPNSSSPLPSPSPSCSLSA